MNVNASIKLFSTSKSSFQSYSSSFKSSKNLRQSLKTLGTKTNMGTEIELVNTRINAAATTAKSVPNKRNINIGRSTPVSR